MSFWSFFFCNSMLVVEPLSWYISFPLKLSKNPGKHQKVDFYIFFFSVVSPSYNVSWPKIESVP